MRKEFLNYILGAGEEFVSQIAPPPRFPQSTAPYTPSEARERLTSRLDATLRAIDQIPKSARAEGAIVAKLTLHPQFLSKSAFPSSLLREVGLTAIGSRPDRIRPEKVDRKSESEIEPTSVIFVSGQQESFQRFHDLVALDSKIAKSVEEEFCAVEDFSVMTQSDRLVEMDWEKVDLVECVLHTAGLSPAFNISEAFTAYARSLNVNVDLKEGLLASGLYFLSATGDMKQLDKLALFTYLRKLRPMPKLRTLLPDPNLRASTLTRVELPEIPTVDSSIVAAVFDTKLPSVHSLNPWIKEFADADVVATTPESVPSHGLMVASAALFGPLVAGKCERPFFSLHHYGVLDDSNISYHKSLNRVLAAVKDRNYPLVNLSFGPPEVINDGDIDAFTAVVDEIAAEGKTLVFVAVGNGGEWSSEFGLNRIQPPSDSVNAIAVGSASSRSARWNRADYSSVGPGRLGCLVKPDLLTFGGTEDEPFGIVGPGRSPVRWNTTGTSFSSPYAMRIAGSLIEAMSSHLSLIAVKTLMLHCCTRQTHDIIDVGHGRMPDEVEQVVTCQSNEVKVVYTGELDAGKYIRHDIPLPQGVEGMIQIDATVCFTSKVDPSYPSQYVQAGVDVVFRPHSQQFNSTVDPTTGEIKLSANPRSEPFFSQSNLYGERHERKDAHLWDTVLKAKKRKRVGTLFEPVLEVHYNRREGGQADPSLSQPSIPYAIILTLRARKDVDLYNLIRQRYGASLKVLVPKLQSQVRT